MSSLSLENLSVDNNLLSLNNKSFHHKNINIFNDNDFKSNINNINLNNHSQLNIASNNLFNRQNTNKNNNNDNSCNKNNIINQNCYQINIKNLNIHNRISIDNLDIPNKLGNINQNYKGEINKKLNESRSSIGSFNSDKSNHNMNLNYLIDNLEKLTSNQSGCRLLQNKIQQNNFYANDLYAAIKTKLDLKKISLDSFGNYLIQKLLEYISNDLIEDYCNNVIFTSFMEIALNPHGSRVIQKLIGRIYLSQNLMNKFNQCLQNSLLEIFLNQSSTYIIISYIYYIKYPNNQMIYSFIVQNIYYIATHKHSCCTLQKCIEEGNNNQRQEILMSLAYISNQLFNDQFGNYAIQFALSFKNEIVNKIIISFYLKDFQKNISNKISSNVYEKILEFCDFQTRQNIIQSLCNFQTVKNLLYNPYGNYVLQKTILVANEPYYSMYIEFLAPLIDGLKTMPNGYIIEHKIMNQFPELHGYSFNNKKNNNVNNKGFNINNNFNYEKKWKKSINDKGKPNFININKK